MNWLSREMRMEVTAQAVEQAIAVVAHAQTIHPVQDYLRSLEWDGVGRLDAFASKYLGAEETEYAQLVGAKWMIAAVAARHGSGLPGR